MEQARVEMKLIAARLEAQYPDTNTQMGVRLEPLHDSYATGPRTALLMLCTPSNPEGAVADRLVARQFAAAPRAACAWARVVRLCRYE